MNPTLCCKATLYYEAKRKDYADSKLPIKTSIKSTDDDLNDLNSHRHRIYLSVFSNYIRFLRSMSSVLQTGILFFQTFPLSIL